jgi:hypothetical protein
MDFEKMQSTMQFLLQQQAKHDVIISQHQDRMNELHQNFKILTKLATELAKNNDERMDSTDQRTDSLEEELRLQVESFRAHLQAQREDFYARLDADTQTFKHRLAESAAHRKAEWDRHDARSEQIHSALDARLDRLAAIVERQIQDRQVSPPN